MNDQSGSSKRTWGVVDKLGDIITGTGRLAIMIATFGIVRPRKLGNLRHDEGSGKKPALPVRAAGFALMMILDSVYFWVGLTVWCGIAVGAALIGVSIFGPIPPIHAW